MPSQTHLPIVTRLQDKEFSEAVVASAPSAPVSSTADLTFQASRATPQQHVNMVFFKLLPSMHRMKRFQAEREHRLSVADLPIALMRLVRANAEARELLLDRELLSLRSTMPGMTMEDIPCVMSLRSITLEHLKTLCVLRSSQSMQYSFRVCPDLPRDHDAATLHSLLQKICQQGNAGFSAVASLPLAEKNMLASLQQSGLLSQDAPVQLTERAQKLLVLATRVREPAPLLAISAAPPQDRTRWELMQALLDSGWEVRVCSASVCRKAPSYMHCEGEKIMYLTQSKDQVGCNRIYLLAL